MNTNSGQARALDLTTSHLQLGKGTCPTCGQDIPSDRIEEISGKVAAREREQELTLTLKLEEQFASERALTETKAKADLEAERQQSAARETRVRDEAQKATDKLVGEKEVEAEQARRKLQEELEEQRQSATNAANALESVRTEAREREKQIKDEATQIAELAAEQRIAAIEEARRESDAALVSRINETETGRVAAEQRESALTLQLEDLRQTNDANVARIREEGAAELSRTRQIATQETEARFRDTLTSLENSAAEAKAKAEEAEGKVLALTDQQAATLEASLNSQREILEKAREEALSAEKARAFEENQKLSTKVSDLQRALENKTAEELGEGAEIEVFETLKASFPDDRISRIAKGTPGGDTIHVVMLRGKECGTILYDSKNHNQFRNDHVTKLRADQLAAKADHAILVTRKFPQGTRQLHIQDGVLLANPARIVLLATILRQHLLNVHTLGLSQIERESKTGALYEFMTSENCKLLLTRIDEQAEGLLEQQTKEMRWHENNWKRQGEAFRAIQKAKADLENRIDSIISAADDSALSKAS